MFKRYTVVCCLSLISLVLSSCGGVASGSPPPPVNFQLSVQATGAGGGTISSNPVGITCGQSCSASFSSGTQVTLTEAAAANSSFAGWSGACSGSNATCSVTLSANQQVTASFNAIQNAVVLTVTLAGTGTGTVTSSPSGINCAPTCTASFTPGTSVTLTETPAANSTFASWAGSGCSGTNSTCGLTLNTSEQVTATFNTTPSLASLTHIIFLAQENRSFDHYFGAMRSYWAQNGYPDQSFDGLPQFNPASGAAPLLGPAPSNPGCDPTLPPPSDCSFDINNPITSYHLITQCIENPSPSWNESHVDWNFNDQVDQYPPAALNGFVYAAAHDARNDAFNDVDGIRAMGYYDGSDLNYYYFMASNFATSDRWFNPVMARTQPNRAELISGTTQGYAYPIGTDPQDTALMTAPTIFQKLQAAGISWKIYVDPTGSSCTAPYDSACLLSLSYVQYFVWGQTIPTAYPQNIAPISQYFTDLANGTLPQVAQIEPATDAGFDEHPSNSDTEPNRIQRGATYVSSLINPLMLNTTYWPNSVFILTFDEFGGLYDHVSPQPTVSPDGIAPVDLLPNDVCTTGVTGPTCNFVYTGYRVPLIVISPYAKKNYVSHNVADTTAILKLIETRFNLPALTERDATQIDMTEFFDFTNPVWMTPPTPPTQATNDACYLNQLP
jgi:phospholipase C